MRPYRDPATFIARNMPLVAASPGVRIHMANPSSGLNRLLGDAAPAPYWAFAWAGGLALTRYMADHPSCVAGLRVLDFGAGSGLVGIAAAKAGAYAVTAAETDPVGVVAIGLNAAANAVRIDVVADDITRGPVPKVDVVLAGDVFYDAALAGAVSGFFDRCVAQGVRVLVGDPGRAHLPLVRLRELARYPVADFGEGAGAAGSSARVLAFA